MPSRRPEDESGLPPEVTARKPEQPVAREGGAEGAPNITPEEIRARVEAELEAQLKEIQPPPNDLFIQLWRRALEIKHNPELAREQKERMIAELKLQSMVDNNTLTHSAPGLLLEGLMREGVWSQDYARRKGKKLSQNMAAELRRSTEGEYDEYVYVVPCAEGVLQEIQRRREFVHKAKWMNNLGLTLFNTWEGTPALVFNRQELPREKISRDLLTGLAGLATTPTERVQVDRIDPQYFRALLVGGDYIDYRGTSEGNKRQEAERMLALQRKVFGDRVELFLPVVVDFSGEVLWPPFEEKAKQEG